MNLLNAVPYSFVIGFLGLIFSLILYLQIKKYPSGNKVMQEIAESIHSGAMIFLKWEYTFISIFVIVIFLILWKTFSISTSLAFFTGASCSMLAGFIG
ncbi:MAG: sodium/proton-translocating pyrophosphatase, partial [Acidobacteriota bacterium]|nr:sodium/proton-translocating pyrophosphatase [Acidobacteriota bacterium]